MIVKLFLEFAHKIGYHKMILSILCTKLTSNLAVLTVLGLHIVKRRNLNQDRQVVLRLNPMRRGFNRAQPLKVKRTMHLEMQYGRAKLARD